MNLDEVSAATARTQLARGLTTDLIIRAIEQEPPPDIINKAMTAKTGRNLVAWGRVAQRVARHSGCIDARALKQDRALALQVIVRCASRDAQLCYADKRDIFKQDLIRYVCRRVRMGDPVAEDSIIVLTRHTIQRWIERGGAGDPRVALMQKLDRSISFAFLKGDLAFAASQALSGNLRDNNGQAARFGIPDPVGGIWVSGLSGFSASASNRSSTRVRHRSLMTCLTYLSHELMSRPQIEYRRRAVDEGIFAAVHDFPDVFRPRGDN